MTINKAWLIALGLLPLFAHAEGKSGDWTYDSDSDESLMGAFVTASDGEVLLGQYCNAETGDCFYVVNFDLTCDEDAKMPALVNTDKGAMSVALVCTSIKADDGTNYMMIDGFDAFDDALRGAKRLGFVVPLKTDEFHAVRFSLRGAVNALDRMREAAQRQQKRGLVEGKPAVQKL